MSLPEDESYQARFESIEAAVDAGQTDLRALGFWRLLAKVKADVIYDAPRMQIVGWMQPDRERSRLNE